MKNLLYLLVLIPSLLNAAPYIFNYQPAGNPWATAGVPGGIPTNRTTVYTTITSTGDSTDRTTAIQNAINSCPANQVVLLGPGTFYFGGLNFAQHNNVVLRGAGMGSTILHCTAASGQGIYMGASDWPPFTAPTSNNTVTNGANAGSTVLTIGDTSAFTAGDILKVKLANQQDRNAIVAGAVPVVKTDSTADELRSQTVVLVSKTANTLTISPALYADYSNLTTKVYRAAYQNQGSGIESLTIDMNGSTAAFGLWMEQCNGCWVKDVKIDMTTSFNFYMLNSVNCEVRRYWSGKTKNYGTNNGSGLIVDGVGHLLAIDSIFYKNFPAIEVNFGTSGSVFAYNYCYESTSGSSVGVSFDTNHGPHNSFNLYEGNTGPNIQADGFFGSVSEDTIFRNWFTSISPGASAPRAPIILKRMTRRYQVVGNLLGTTGQNVATYGEIGTPNIGNGSSSGTAQPSANDFWGDWGNAAGPAGYQELDLDVQASSTFKGNYSTQSGGGIISGESLGTSTLPASLFLAGKPAWFGNLNWPAYDPSNPNLSATAIPAGYRYINGSEVPSGSTIPPSNATITISAP